MPASTNAGTTKLRYTIVTNYFSSISFRNREALMARRNRRDIFDPNEVGSFHAVQRTVRRAWLCGMDPVSGKSFEHRRTWIQD